MESINWNEIIQATLMTLIQFLLPIVLVASLTLAYQLWNKYKAQLSTEQLAFVTSLIENFIKAAEQQGLLGAISNEGAKKKEWVIDKTEEALGKRGLRLDLGEISDLIEGIYYETIRRWKEEQEGQKEAAKVVAKQSLVALQAVNKQAEVATKAVEKQAEVAARVVEAEAAAQEASKDVVPE